MSSPIAIVLVVLGILTATTLSSSSLPSGLGFDLSNGLQSSHLSPEVITGITSSELLDGVKYYKIYGNESDFEIAKAIFEQCSSSSDIQFYIEIPPFRLWNELDDLLDQWDIGIDHIYCLALKAESREFSHLPTYLEVSLIQYLKHRVGWEAVPVSIPFSVDIFAGDGNMWPPEKAVFNSTYKPVLRNIIRIYKDKDHHFVRAPFSINLYPFLDHIDNPDKLPFQLGRVTDGGYGSLLEAMYAATDYAMKDAMGGEHGLEIVVTETGWSRKSSVYEWATETNAKEYAENTLRSMNDSKSPLFGQKVFWFELFDEDGKGDAAHDWENSFGWYDQHGDLKLTIPCVTVPCPTPTPTSSPTSNPTMNPTSSPEAPTSMPPGDGGNGDHDLITYIIVGLCSLLAIALGSYIVWRYICREHDGDRIAVSVKSEDFSRVNSSDIEMSNLRRRKGKRRI